MGRLSEIFKKNNNAERYSDSVFLSILYSELRNLRKWRSKSREFNIQDVTDLVNGIRELQLQNVDEELLKYLCKDTLDNLNKEENGQSRRLLDNYAALYFNWAFLINELGYSTYEGMQQFVYELAFFFMKMRQRPTTMQQICTIARALQMIAPI